LFTTGIEIVAGCTYIACMRCSRSILSALVAANFLLTSIATALGEDSSKTDVQQNPRREWHELANNRKEFEVSDPASMPRLLALEVERSGCRYKEEIANEPARFVTIDRNRLAIVYCRAGIVGSHRVFDLSDLRKPRQVEFPILSYKGGFGTTAEPGAIAWNRDAGVFEAQFGSDMCPSPAIRHTYRLDQFKGLSFVVTRVEVAPDGCGAREWMTIWEATPWPEQAVVP
jgi:hypothetical protein